MTTPPELGDCDPAWTDTLPPPTTHLTAQYTPDGQRIEDVVLPEEYL